MTQADEPPPCRRCTITYSEFEEAFVCKYCGRRMNLWTRVASRTVSPMAMEETTFD